MSPLVPRKKRIPKARFPVVGGKAGLVPQVVKAIEDQILNGRLPVGTRLPAEREFAESLAVSRPVVREAVRTLVTKGLLETRQGIGTTVRTLTHDEVTTPLTLFLRTCGEEVNLEHLHQVRSIIEVESAGLAAIQRTDDDLAELTRLCDEMWLAAGDQQQFAAKDSEFHRRLTQTTHNPLLVLLLDSIQKMMVEVRDLVARQPHLADRVMPTHTLILQRVAAQQTEGARDAMREHLGIALAIQRELIRQRAG